MGHIRLTAKLEKRYQELEAMKDARPDPADVTWEAYYTSYWEQMAELYEEARELAQVDGHSLLWSVLYDAWEAADRKARLYR